MNTGTSTGSMIKKPTTNTNGVRKSFGPDGCQAITDGTKCGETKNLQIIKEFNRLYEDKMKQIDDIAGGDCIQAKVNLQQEWIKDLTEQNEMLVKVVEELEVAAAERVAQLEKKLQQSAKSAGEEAGDSMMVALPYAFMTHEVPVHLRMFTSKSAPVHVESVDKEVQTIDCTVSNTPNWMGIVQDIIERTEHEKTLISTLENECKNLVKQLGNRDKYIFDQNDLIVLLVHKLYVVYRTLRHLEDKTNVMVRSIKYPSDKQLDSITIKFRTIIIGLQKVVRKSIEKIEDEKCLHFQHRRLIK